MGLPPDPLWLIVAGREAPEVYQRLVSAEGLLNGAVSNRIVGGYLLPTALLAEGGVAERQSPSRGVLGRQACCCARRPSAKGSAAMPWWLTENWCGPGPRRRRQHGCVLADQQGEPMAAETLRRAGRPTNCW